MTSPDPATRSPATTVAGLDRAGRLRPATTLSGTDEPAMVSAAGPQDSPGFLLWRVTLRWQRRIAVALRPLELTHVQFVLLATVWWLADQAESPAHLPSQTQVANHAAVDVMMTSQVLRVLETRGLVSRASDRNDARVKRLAVTVAGRQLAERAITVVEAADAGFFEAVDEPAHLLDVLHQLS